MSLNSEMWLNLQLFADGGAAGDGGASTGAGEGQAADTGVTAPVAGEQRLRELGVPESVLHKRAQRAKARGQQTEQLAQPVAPVQTAPQQAASAENTQPTENNEPKEESKPDDTAKDAPKRMTWDEIMADPEYNKAMQDTVRARLKDSDQAKDSLQKLAPAMELLARKYGMDAKNLDPAALAKAIQDDDSYYEDKALEMGVSIETAKKIDQTERETARQQEEAARTAEQQRIDAHIQNLFQQGEKLKAVFPNFDLRAELQNPAFMRMTSPNGGVSVEDAYYAVHRKEIQEASMQVAAQKTAQQMANAIRSNQSRPVESGSSGTAPSVTSFDYAHASKEQRESLKKQIRDAAARGQKIYPGQF